MEEEDGSFQIDGVTLSHEGIWFGSVEQLVCLFTEPEMMGLTDFRAELRVFLLSFRFHSPLSLLFVLLQNRLLNARQGKKGIEREEEEGNSGEKKGEEEEEKVEEEKEGEEGGGEKEMSKEEEKEEEEDDEKSKENKNRKNEKEKEKEKEKYQIGVEMKIAQLLSVWVSECAASEYSFSREIDPLCLELLKDLGGHQNLFISKMVNNAYAKLLEISGSFPHFQPPELFTSTAKEEDGWFVAGDDAGLESFSVHFLADQLTLVSQYYYGFFHPTEFLISFKWNSEQQPILRATISFFRNFESALLYWILSSDSHSTFEHRCNFLGKLAKALLIRHNYFAYVILYSAVSNGCISRGCRHSTSVGSDFQALRESNFSNPQVQRKLLRSSTEEGVTITPFFGIFLRDLLFINEGNGDAPAGVNFRKMKMIVQCLDNLLKYQKFLPSSSRTLQLDPKFIEAFSSLKFGMTEEDMFRRSMEIFPRRGKDSSPHNAKNVKGAKR